MVLLLPLLSLTGCKVVDAPDALEDLAVFGFVTFEDGDAFRESTAAELLGHMEANREELLEGYRVDSLTGDDLIEARVDAEPPGELLGMAATIEMASSVDDIVGILVSDSIAEDFTTTLDYEITASTDVECFLAHTCDQYTFSAIRTNDLGLVGTSVQSFEMSLVWTELPDGRTGVMARQLAPEPNEMSSNLIRIHQNYIFDLIVPTDDGCERFQANWIDFELLGLDLPDAIALDLAVNALGNRAEEMDALVAGTNE